MNHTFSHASNHGSPPTPSPASSPMTCTRTTSSPAFELVSTSVATPLASVFPSPASRVPSVVEKRTVSPATGSPAGSLNVARMTEASVPLAIKFSGSARTSSVTPENCTSVVASKASYRAVTAAVPFRRSLMRWATARPFPSVAASASTVPSVVENCTVRSEMGLLFRSRSSTVMVDVLVPSAWMEVGFAMIRIPVSTISSIWTSTIFLISGP